MSFKTIVVLPISLALLLSTSENQASAKVLYNDKHGVRVEYAATDTGRYTRCSGPPEHDLNYTTKKIKVWEVNLKITNGSGRRIKPESPGIAWIDVEPHKGSTLGYCSYRDAGNLRKVDGHGDQSKLMFSIAAGVYAIAPGRTLSNSTYLYLYEDQEPLLTKWRFGGYRFLNERLKKPRESARQVSPGRTTAASKPGQQSSRPSRDPSGSLILLMDVSGSMRGAKLSSAKRAAIDTIRKAIRNKSEVAVLAFEGDCSDPIDRSIGFIRNEKQLVAFVGGLSAQGGTPLATALEATNRFMKRHRSATSKAQMILLLADGNDDCGSLDTVLRRLKQANLLYRHETVGLEVSGAAQRQLREIATQSGGNYHHATSQNLSKVFSDALDLTRMLNMLGKFK